MLFPFGCSMGDNATHVLLAKGEFLTGLIYVNSKRRDFVSMQNKTPTPLALLPDELLRPSKEVLEKIMETI